MRFKHGIILVLLAIINNAFCARYVSAGQKPEYLDLVANSVTDLAQKISVAVVDPKSKTEIFSPVSIAGALSLLFLGSSGITKTELMKVMGFQDKQINFTDIHKSFAGLFTDLVSNEPSINVSIPWRETDKCSNYDYEDDYAASRANFQNNDNQRKQRDADNVEVSIGNGIFTQQSTIFHEKYKLLASELYKTDLEYVDFQRNSQKAVNTINNWVRQRTKGKISEIVSQLDPTTMLVVANTLYFKADWQEPFLKDGTRPRMFFPNGPKKPGKNVPMMVHSGCFPYYEWTEADAKVMGFPYKRNITMYVFLPKDSDMSKVRALHARMDAATINDIIGKMEVKSVSVQFPKMNIQNSFNLKEILQQLGMYSLFNPNTSELYHIIEGMSRFDELLTEDILDALGDTEQNAISILKKTYNCKLYTQTELEQKLCVTNATRCVYGGNSCFCCLGKPGQRQRRSNAEGAQNRSSKVLYVDEVIHKVNLVMDEKGTEGAAVTATLIDRIGSGVNFRTSGPFVFLIRDETTHLPLFYGSVYDPVA